MQRNFKKYGKQFLVAAIDYSYDKKFKLYIPKNRSYVDIDIENHLKKFYHMVLVRFYCNL